MRLRVSSISDNEQKEKDVSTDLPNGWSDLCVFRMLLRSHFLSCSHLFPPTVN